MSNRAYTFQTEYGPSYLRVTSRTAQCCGVRTIYDFPEVSIGSSAKYLAKPGNLKSLLKKIIVEEQEILQYRDDDWGEPDLSEEFIALAFNLTEKQIDMFGGDRILKDFEELGFKPMYSWVNANTQNKITHFAWLGV